MKLLVTLVLSSDGFVCVVAAEDDAAISSVSVAVSVLVVVPDCPFVAFLRPRVVFTMLEW